jgi:hypothetical protein
MLAISVVQPDAPHVWSWLGGSIRQCVGACQPHCCMRPTLSPHCGVLLYEHRPTTHNPQAPPAMVMPHAVRICEAAATPLMGVVRVSRSLQENSAITLGRTAMVCPDQVRTHMHTHKDARMHACMHAHTHARTRAPCGERGMEAVKNMCKCACACFASIRMQTANDQD